MTAKEIKKEIAGLRFEDAQKLEVWLHEHLKALKKKEQEQAKKKREVLKEEHRGSWLYQQIAVRCGKVNCKCNHGEPHGAYWYAYRREGKKMKSQYIGKDFKELPD